MSAMMTPSSSCDNLASYTRAQGLQTKHRKPLSPLDLGHKLAAWDHDLYMDHMDAASPKWQTTKALQLLTPPATPTSSRSRCSSPTPDESAANIDDLHIPLWSQDDVVTTSYHNATFDVAVQPALIGVGADSNGAIVAVHIQSSDRTVELSLQRYNKQWEIYQPIQNELGKTVGWSIGETRCYDDEHYTVAGERSTSVWSASSQTYGAYRERLSTSGKVAEIHLKLGEDACFYIAYQQHRGWHLHEYPSLAFSDRKYSKNMFFLIFSHLATYLEATSLMQANGARLSPSSNTASCSGHDDESDSECSPFRDILHNKMRDATSQPTWRRRIRHLIRVSNDQASERSYALPLPPWSAAAIAGAWLTFVISFVWSIGLRWDLPVFCGLVYLGCIWPAFAYQNFDEGEYHVQTNVFAPAIVFSILWRFALIYSSVQTVFYCLLIAFIWHRVVVYRRCAWATESRSSRLSLALGEFEHNVTWRRADSGSCQRTI